jgi:hypothetical protein
MAKQFFLNADKFPLRTAFLQWSFHFPYSASAAPGAAS